MSDELAERAAQAVELAQKKGAEGAWATASRSRGLSIAVRNGEFEKVQENVSRSLSLRLFVEGSLHRALDHGSHTQPVEEFVEQAVALTRALEPDPDRLLPDPKLFEGRPTATYSSSIPTSLRARSSSASPTASA